MNQLGRSAGMAGIGEEGENKVWSADEKEGIKGPGGAMVRKLGRLCESISRGARG